MDDEEVRSIFFVLAMKEEPENAPFVRVSSENVKQADLLAGPISGTNGRLYIVKTNVPVNTRQLEVQTGKIGGSCSTCTCCVSDTMDPKQYRIKIKSDCILFLNWGLWIRMHRINPGPQIIFFHKCKVENVVMAGNIEELGQWAEKSVQDQNAFNVQPGLCIASATVPLVEQDIEFNLVYPTDLGMVWEAPSQGNKKFHHPGLKDLVVYSVWGDNTVLTSEIPCQAVTVIHVSHWQMSSQHLAASLYRLAHIPRSSISKPSKASEQDIKNFAAELHEATKDHEESEEDAKDEVTKKVVSIHNVSVESVANKGQSSKDKDPILVPPKKPGFKRRVSISVQKTFQRPKKGDDLVPQTSSMKTVSEKTSAKKTSPKKTLPGKASATNTLSEKTSATKTPSPKPSRTKTPSPKPSPKISSTDTASTTLSQKSSAIIPPSPKLSATASATISETKI